MRNDGRVSESVDQSRLYPRVTSFRFRRGTPTTGQQRNWEQLWPRLGRDLAIGTDRVPEEPIDLPEFFGRNAPVVLEIGSGTGISTAAMATEEPDVDVLAVEVYRGPAALVTQPLATQLLVLC